MQRSILAVALATLAVAALAVGGASAVVPSAPGTAEQPDDHPTIDGYEFTVVDHDDWLADRDADAAAVAELLFEDEATGSELRSLFDTDQRLAIDVYGSLAGDADTAHVVVTPAPGVRASAPSEQHPRVEATVDLETGSVDLVGASGPEDASGDAVTVNASETDVETDLVVHNTTGDSDVVRVTETDSQNGVTVEVVDAVDVIDLELVDGNATTAVDVETVELTAEANE